MVKVIGRIGVFSTHLGFAWINQKKKGDDSIWNLLYDHSTCRTYLSCFLFGTTIDKKYIHSEFGRNVLVEDTAPDEDTTSIFVSCDGKASLPAMIAQVESKIHDLHKREKLAGTSLTRYIIADDPTGVIGIIFIGDKVWHSNIWKSTLYSYYLKKMCKNSPFLIPERDMYEDQEKEKALKPYEKTLLSKITTEFTETFANHGYYSVHEYSGFYTICEGLYNLPMTELLLGKEACKRGDK